MRDDAASWRDHRGCAVRGEDCFAGGFESSYYFKEFISPGGLRYMAASPLKRRCFRDMAGRCTFIARRDRGRSAMKNCGYSGTR